LRFGIKPNKPKNASIFQFKSDKISINQQPDEESNNPQNAPARNSSNSWLLIWQAQQLTKY
jgi:hypothetical protein